MTEEIRETDGLQVTQELLDTLKELPIEQTDYWHKMCQTLLLDNTLGAEAKESICNVIQVRRDELGEFTSSNTSAIPKVGTALSEL